jgi:hypothetical protein
VINDDSNSRRIDKKPSEFVFLHANSLNVKRIYREQRSCRESQLIETSRFLRKTMKNVSFVISKYHRITSFDIFKTIRNETLLAICVVATSNERCYLPLFRGTHYLSPFRMRIRTMWGNFRKPIQFEAFIDRLLRDYALP